MSANVLCTPLEELTSYFLPSDLSLLDPLTIPKHVAIIPDGNRRWAEENREIKSQGHRRGADILLEIVKAASELKIQTVTLFAFSTENWNRSDEEVTTLFALIASYLNVESEEMVACGVKLETIGDLFSLPPFLQEEIQAAKKRTEDCEKITLVLALNYGARNEICRAVRGLIEDYEKGCFTKEEINESKISAYLDTKKWEDPDLLIRTSNEMRISNFLLWQMSYTEIHVSPVFWPDFTPHHLLEAVIDFQNRNRRWGGT